MLPIAGQTAGTIWLTFFMDAIMKFQFKKKVVYKQIGHPVI